MEILRGYEQEIKMVVPKALTTATYRVYRNATQVGTDLPAVVADGIAVVKIPYSCTQFDGYVDVTLSFYYENQLYTKDARVEVITPYLELHEIRDIHSQATDKEAIDLEASIRHVIGALTGQTFGLQKDAVHKVRGAGSTTLALPKRLVRVGKINGYYSTGITLKDDGWQLHYRGVIGPPSVKADYDGYHEYKGVIRNPNNVYPANFMDGVEYSVSGDWGWSEVPEPVREAARLLANDYACANTTYRDRFLTSMTAADWRIQFHSGAFRHTGNVRADQLLQEFIVPTGWAVV